jgi:hypothetical protein
MPESRHIVDLAEIEKNIVIWLAVPSQRRPSLVRDLWTRRGEDHDATRIGHARHELARYLAGKIDYVYELTRPEGAMDQVHAENRALAARERAEG